MSCPTPDGAPTRGPGDPYVPTHGDPRYSVSHYDLDLDYRMANNQLKGRATLDVTTTQACRDLRLDLSGLRPTKVLVDGRRPAGFRVRADKLVVTLAEPVAAGATLAVEVTYGGSPRPVRGICGDVGWEELREGVLVAGQPEGAPSWFPCNDHPGDKASYRISVTTDSPYRVVANGTLVEHRVGASRTTWVWRQPEPMATYLATVQIGRYELVELSPSPVALHLAVPARLRRRALGDFGRQADMVRLFQRLFGPWPFTAGYTAVVTDDDLEIPLESQGLATFGANHCDGRRGAERLVAHELSYQWFGNSVGLRRWQDVWLNEGFACYSEWLWSEWLSSQGSGGRSADASARRWWGRLAALPQDLVLADPGPALMFDDRVYKRGALTLHALRLTLGDTDFFDLLRAWVARHRHGTATTEDFVAHVAEHAGDHAGTHSVERAAAVTGLLEQWLWHPALPPLPPPPAPR